MRRLALALSAVVVLVAMPAAAGTFVALDETTMVRDALAVIQGQVTHQQSFWSEDGKIILTESQVRVDETIVGEAPAFVTVRTFGGQVGDMIVGAPGFPKFEDGERVLLFLGHEPADDSIRVLGYQQGQFRVVTRRDGVTLAVPMVDEDVRFLSPKGGLAPASRSVEINAFKAHLRSLAGQVRIDVK